MSTVLSASTLSAKEAAKQLGVSRGLIELWAKEPCPFLDGATLSRIPNPHSRKGVRYPAEQIEAIKTARDAASRIRGRADGYVTADEARKRFKFNQNTLYGWHDKGCPCLNGAKLDGRRETRPVAKGNGLREIWVYKLAQLERIAEARDREQAGIFEDEQGVWLSAAAAHDLYGIWDASLGDWQTRPCSFLGRTVTHKLMRRLIKSGRHPTRTVYLESDLEAIAAAQRAPAQPATYQDAEGTWLFAVEVARRTGWSATGLWYYRKQCPDLRAKQVPAAFHPCPCISLNEVWVYHEDDVERVAAAQKNEPPVPMAIPLDPQPGLLVESPLQKAILAALVRKALTGDALEALLRVDRRRLYYGGTPNGLGGLKELCAHGRVKAGRGRHSSGYYRPDCPPER